jgi:predicted kinase
MAPKKGSTEKPPVDVCVVILGGLPGSGKSTLRERLVKNGWAYVSQDEMGSSDACEKALVKALKNQKSCVVDRCNVTSSERRLWMQYANRAVEKKEAKGVKLHFEAVWMATSPEVCKDRVKSRQGHETLSAENADAVVDEFCKGMRVPERTGQEPYECVQFVATADDADLVCRGMQTQLTLTAL